MTGLAHHRRSAFARFTGAALLTMVGFVGLPAGPVSAGPVPIALVSHAYAPPGDTVRAQQWQLDKLDAAAAWRIATGKGITIAVVDSGVDGSHPDLVGQVLPGTDLVRRSGDGRIDPVGHGTTVAALIAGRGDDDRGVIGLAPNAKILPIRVLDEKNRYDDALVVAQGVRWAVDAGAQVINLSLGGNGHSLALAAALDYAFTHDVVVVACTGNKAPTMPDELWYPAREPGVIAVTGLAGDSDRLWSGSLTGPETTLAAPATGLLGARPGGFWQVQGTSFAAPMVAATAALIRSRWPDMSAGDVINRLIRTARDLGPAGRDDRFGFGLVDPVAALSADVPRVARNPLDDGESTGVVGLGPAPGLATGAPALSNRFGQLGGHPAGARQAWATRPAGTDTDRPHRMLWVGGLLLVVVSGGGVLLARRFGLGHRWQRR